MNVGTLLSKINDVIPFDKAESWDNVGLLIGDINEGVNGILTTLDCTLEVVNEALEKNCNVIIAHHPLIFKGLKSINEEGYNKIIRLLIKHNIHLIAMHTNLDHYEKGVSYYISEKIGLKNPRILLPLKEKHCYLQTYVPKDNATHLKDALAAVGVGEIGNYKHCFYTTEGTGEFEAQNNANPYVGNIGEVHYEAEMKIEGVFKDTLTNNVIQTLMANHPYETPAYQIMPFEVESNFGTGIVADLESPLVLKNFAELVKERLQLDVVKIVGNSKDMIHRVGIIGGSGFDFYQSVKRSNVDVFLTGDIKYHEAHDLLMHQLNTLDISHYSEYVMKDGLKSILELMDLDCRIIASEVNSDPFQVI